MTDTVTGLTADRMLAIEAASIVNGEIDETGHLILSRFDGTPVDAGKVFDERGNIELARAEVTSGTPSNSSTSAYADISGLSITFTVDTRPVDVHLYLPAVYMTAAGSFWVAIRSGSTAVVAKSQGRAINIVDEFNLHKHLTVPGTYTYKASFFATAGVANVLFGTSALATNAVGFIAAYER